MRWAAILAVLRKELRETLRDRRTLVVMIVVPVLLYPVMLIMIEQITLFGQRSLEATAVTVVLVGPAPDDGFVGADPNIIALRRDTVPGNALRDGTVDAILVFPDVAWSGTGTNQLHIFYDQSRERSTYARRIVQQRIGLWADSMIHHRLQGEGLPPEFASPVTVHETSVATPRDVGGYMLGRFLPLLLILMTILGAFYPSIDLAAGEKERGTLEALLTVPVPADHLVIGKFAAAALMGLTAAALNLGSMLLTFQSGLLRFGGAMDIQFQLPAHAALLILGVLALLAVLFSALFLGIAVRSHSFKEAQNALTPVYILSLIPAMLPMMPGIRFTAGFALLPVAGVGFLFRDLMTGTVAAAPAITAVAATAFYAALALVFAARAFGREEVLFGIGGAGASAARGRGWRSLLNRPRAGALPRPGAALGLIAVAALLFFYGGRPLAVALGERGLLISQWLFLAVPALLLVLGGRYDLRATLALRRPSAIAAAATVLILAGGIPIGWLIAWLQGFVLDVPQDFLEAMRRFIAADSPGRLLWLLLVVAVTPAVCEELVFRGVLLHSLRTRLTPWAAIMASALLFGAFHLSFETAVRFLPTAWLGLLLAYVVWHSRSIFTGMLMHLLNNGLVVVLLAVPALRERFADHGAQPPWTLIAIAPFVLYAGLRLLPTRGEEPQAAAAGAESPSATDRST